MPTIGAIEKAIDEPIYTYRKGVGWVPCVSIMDFPFKGDWVRRDINGDGAVYYYPNALSNATILEASNASELQVGDFIPFHRYGYIVTSLEPGKHRVRVIYEDGSEDDYDTNLNCYWEGVARL